MTPQYRLVRPLLSAGFALGLGLVAASSAAPVLADGLTQAQPNNYLGPRDEVAEKAAGRTFVTEGGDVCVWHTGAVLELIDHGDFYTADGVRVRPTATSSWMPAPRTPSC